MTKTLKSRVLSAAGAFALAVGLSGALTTAAQAQISHPSMDITVVCSDDGKQANITARTTDTGGMIHPDNETDSGHHKLSRYVTVNGAVVGEVEYTSYGNEVTYENIPLPAGDVEFGGYFIYHWWEKDDERKLDGTTYDDTTRVLSVEGCGWEDDGETSEPEPTYTPTDGPVDPEPTPSETESEPSETDSEESPEPVETAPGPSQTEAEVTPLPSATDGGADEERMPDTGASPLLITLALTLVAAGGAALLYARRNAYNA